MVGSEIRILPPLPTAPEPDLAPPEVEINVSLRVIVVALVLRVTFPPLPPAVLPLLAALPVVTISAPVEIVKVPESLASIDTVPAAIPAPLVEVPPVVVISPPITIFPVVLPDPGFLTAEEIVTEPPAVSLLPVVTIVDVAEEVNEPAPSDCPPYESPVSLAPLTKNDPPKVVISTLFPSVTSPWALKWTSNSLLVAVISALITISSAAKRTSRLAAVLPELIAAETVMVPTSLSPFSVIM